MTKINFKHSLVNLMIIFTFLAVGLSACEDDEPTPIISSPTLNNASDIQSVSFKASWTEVSGADKYLLDVSTSQNFGTLLTGYNKKEVTEEDIVVTGLTANTKYYFRVYAKKGDVISNPSTVKEVTTAN